MLDLSFSLKSRPVVSFHVVCLSVSFFGFHTPFAFCEILCTHRIINLLTAARDAMNNPSDAVPLATKQTSIKKTIKIGRPGYKVIKQQVSPIYVCRVEHMLVYTLHDVYFLQVSFVLKR